MKLIIKPKEQTLEEIFNFPYEVEPYKISFVKCLDVEFLEGSRGNILVLRRALKAGRNTGGFNYKYWYVISTKTLIEIRNIEIADVAARKKRIIMDNA